MKKLFLFVLIAVSSSAFADGFNFSAYQLSSLGEISAKWNQITQAYKPGISVKQPEKLLLSAISLGLPVQCDTQILAWVHNILGAQRALQQAPTSHCIRIKENSTSPEIVAYIQDALIPSYIAEVKPESSINLYVVFLAYKVNEDHSTNVPVLMVNEFKAL